MPSYSGDRSSTVDQALRILTLFLYQEPVGIKEVQERFGICRTAAVRLLSTMEDNGLLVGHGRPKHYRLGSLIFGLANKHAHDNLSTVAHAIMTELMEKTQETVYLVVRLGNRYHEMLEKVEPQTDLKYTPQLGVLVALTNGASGKLFMAHMPRKQLDAYLHAHEPVRYTPNTITDRDLLQAELSRIRRQGYAVDNCEMKADLVSIAAPIFAGYPEPSATLGISLPAYRTTDEKLADLADILLEYASMINGELKRHASSPSD